MVLNLTDPCQKHQKKLKKSGVATEYRRIVNETKAKYTKEVDDEGAEELDDSKAAELDNPKTEELDDPKPKEKEDKKVTDISFLF